MAGGNGVPAQTLSMGATMIYNVFTSSHVVLAGYATKRAAMRHAKKIDDATVGLIKPDGYIIRMWTADNVELFWSDHYSDWRLKNGNWR